MFSLLPLIYSIIPLAGVGAVGDENDIDDADVVLVDIPENRSDLEERLSLGINGKVRDMGIATECTISGCPPQPGFTELLTAGDYTEFDELGFSAASLSLLDMQQILLSVSVPQSPEHVFGLDVGESSANMVNWLPMTNVNDNTRVLSEATTSNVSFVETMSSMQWPEEEHRVSTTKTSMGSAGHASLSSPQSAYVQDAEIMKFFEPAPPSNENAFSKFVVVEPVTGSSLFSMDASQTIDVSDYATPIRESHKKNAVAEGPNKNSLRTSSSLSAPGHASLSSTTPPQLNSMAFTVPSSTRPDIKLIINSEPAQPSSRNGSATFSMQAPVIGSSTISMDASQTTNEREASQPIKPAEANSVIGKGLWSLEEHKNFLLGMSRYGKGSWTDIARDFVRTRTPVQVSSHAQKYFLRIKRLTEKHRWSINDIKSFDEASIKRKIPGLNKAGPSTVPPMPKNKGPVKELPQFSTPNMFPAICNCKSDWTGKVEVPSFLK